VKQFTGISFGQELTPEAYKELDNARTTYRHVRNLTLDVEYMRYTTSEQKTNLERQLREASALLEEYKRQECIGPVNNAQVHISKSAMHAPGGFIQVRVVLMWVPQIFRKDSMLPLLYKHTAALLGQDEFVDNIEFF